MQHPLSGVARHPGAVYVRRARPHSTDPRRPFSTAGTTGSHFAGLPSVDAPPTPAIRPAQISRPLLSVFAQGPRNLDALLKPCGHYPTPLPLCHSIMRDSIGGDTLADKLRDQAGGRLSSRKEFVLEFNRPLRLENLDFLCK